ncbi:aromatase/cyclase [Rhizohabitans arisaemae]|uniref:aromatase/cyclase n=1 Tax=Rhizohabitans arisaemae TaxID=2720610 RepID=UPI0024B216CA|nr:aromatase/cyclase [Rhizohabitans arisaemae]
MPLIVVTERLKSPPLAVWDLILDVKRYPELMECVLLIELLDHVGHADGSTESVVGWEVELEGSVLRWVERERHEPDRLRVTFEQVAGDMDRFSGHWQVLDEGEGITSVTLEVDFEIGIPVLRDVLDPFAAAAIRRNSSDMLLSLGPKA